MFLMTGTQNGIIYPIFLCFRYKVEVSGKSLPVLRNGEKGRFSTILFENYTKYLSLDEWNRNILDKYCAEFDIGIVGFMPSRDETFVGAELRNTAASLLIDTNVRIKVSILFLRVLFLAYCIFMMRESGFNCGRLEIS